MRERKDLLAYCGFYCGSCLGYTGVIADSAANFKEVLETYKFDRTAKSVFPEELKDYDKFCEILEFMTGLKCGKICRERKDSETICEIRKCCTDRNFFACFECTDFETCEKLRSTHGGLHYDSSLKNLRAIKEMGLKNWLIRGKRYCYWNEKED